MVRDAPSLLDTGGVHRLRQRGPILVPSRWQKAGIKNRRRHSQRHLNQKVKNLNHLLSP